jgi:quinol monooxygenase YgiN
MHIVAFARWRAKEGEVEAVLERAQRMAIASRLEPGCLEYRVHQAIGDPREILLYERYESLSALDAHRASAHFQALVVGEVLPRLELREVGLLNELEGA